MVIKYPCKDCVNQYARIVQRGLVIVHVACTKCGRIMEVSKTLIKVLEIQQKS